MPLDDLVPSLQSIDKMNSPLQHKLRMCKWPRRSVSLFMCAPAAREPRSRIRRPPHEQET
jgi:hypothetical protein